MENMRSCFSCRLANTFKNKGDLNVNDQKFVAKTMNQINIIQAYKEKYGEDDINDYFKKFGTWQGIEDYLSQQMVEKAKEKDT